MAGVLGFRDLGFRGLGFGFGVRSQAARRQAIALQRPRACTFGTSPEFRV